MIKRLLILSGSPRTGGNSEPLCEELCTALQRSAMRWRSFLYMIRRLAIAPLHFNLLVDEAHVHLAQVGCIQSAARVNINAAQVGARRASSCP